MRSYHVVSDVTAGILALCEEVSVIRLHCTIYSYAICLRYAFHPRVIFLLASSSALKMELSSPIHGKGKVVRHENGA